MRKEARWFLGLVLAALLVWGLGEVLLTPLQTGETYPPYSSLRTDPLGSRALYESLGELPEVSVERWYKEWTWIHPAEAAVLVLGVQADSWAVIDEKTLEEYEGLARGGARLVIGFLPSRKPYVSQPLNIPSPDAFPAKPPETPPVEKRWGLKFSYREPVSDEPEGRGVPKKTDLIMEAGPEWEKLDPAGATLQRGFGQGSVVLATETFPLSNEGLRDERDAAWIARLIGPAKRIIFDENHLGVVESGSIVELMRKYHLEGAILVLAVVSGLFLWRTATSFLPPLTASTVVGAVSGRDSLEGLASLLRRGINEKELLSACYAEWAKSAGHGARAESRKQQVEETISRAGKTDSVTGYREVQRILTERSR